jgi:hypothetical protein
VPGDLTGRHASLKSCPDGFALGLLERGCSIRRLRASCASCLPWDKALQSTGGVLNGLVELGPALPSCAFSPAPLKLGREFVQETGQAIIGQAAKLSNQRLGPRQRPPRAWNRRRGHIAEQVGRGWRTGRPWHAPDMGIDLYRDDA